MRWHLQNGGVFVIAKKMAAKRSPLKLSVGQQAQRVAGRKAVPLAGSFWLPTAPSAGSRRLLH